jgi:carbon storage regulator
MLVLSRRISERIVIGEGKNQVTVTVTRISGDRVRLGFDADQTIRIRRSELVPEAADAQRSA